MSSIPFEHLAGVATGELMIVPRRLLEDSARRLDLAIEYCEYAHINRHLRETMNEIERVLE